LSLPIISLPKHSTTIPSTGEKVQFVPYTNAQEKLILISAEGGDVAEIMEATKNLLSECYINVDVNSLTSYDIDYLFLQLRIQSVSSTSELYFRSLNCGNTGEECEKTIKMTIDLSNVKVQQMDDESGQYKEYVPKKQKGDGEVIAISDTVGVTIRHPGFTIQEKFAKIKDGTEDDLIKLCITSIYDEESVYTRDDFTEQELSDFYDAIPPKQVEALREYLRKIPMLRYETKFVCKECGMTEPILFESFEDFFG
jgi:hypothetical protein